MEAHQLAFQVEVEAATPGLKRLPRRAFSAACSRSSNQIIPSHKMPMPLHRFSSPRLLSQPPTSVPISSMALLAKP